MKKYTVDKSHSSIEFNVRHMMVSKVKGAFPHYEAAIEASNIEDLSTAKISFELETAGITTGSPDRDNHLRSPDFFDADKYPKIAFTSTSITGSGSSYKVTGDMTIKDVTKQVTFDAKYNGKAPMTADKNVYGFEAKTSINRFDFGLTWNAMVETGGLVVSDNVNINVELEITPVS